MANQLMNGKNILIRCDASQRLGFGHLVRCLALGEELRDNHGARVTFALREGRAAVELIRACGFSLHAPEENRPFHYDSWLDELVALDCPKVMIIDVRDDLSRESVSKLRDSGIFIVVLDDPHERRLAADLVIYPPVPQLEALDWEGFSGNVHAGWQLLLLRRQFAGLPARVPHDPPRVLVTMGGSDPAGQTLRAVEALASCYGEFTTTVVAGPGYPAMENLAGKLADLQRPYELLSNVEDMAALMLRSDLAIATFGVTAYELAATGTPALLLCLDSDHVVSSRALTETGAAVSLGLQSEIDDGQLARFVGELLTDINRRQLMSASGKALIDGRGSQRVAALIMSELERTKK